MRDLYASGSIGYHCRIVVYLCAATILFKLKVQPKVVQELLGHSTVSMTMDLYTHYIPSLYDEAMGHMDDLFD